MIWVLQEITLPLCLAFLFGLGAGWLFWRWRRRTISQAEWANQGKMSKTDALRFSALQEEVGVYQRRAEQLNASTQQYFTELREAKERTQKLTEELQSANDKIAAFGDNKSNHKVETPNKLFDDTSSIDFPSIESSTDEVKQKHKIQELEFRSNNLQKRVNEKDRLLQQADRDIKRLNSELEIANDQLTSKAPVISEDDLLEVESKLAQVTEENSVIEKKLQQAKSDASVLTNTNNELTAQAKALENTIERQSDENLEEKRKARQLTEELTTISAKLSAKNQNGDEQLRTLQRQLDTEVSEKNEVAQKLKDATSAGKQQEETANQHKQTIDKLEHKIAQQSTDLQESEVKLAHMADDLKTALERLEKQDRSSRDSTDELKSNLDSVTNEKTQLSRKIQEANSRAAAQTALANELQQKLKQSENIASERDAAIAQLNQLKDELGAARQQHKELHQTKAQLENISERFKNFQASAVANREAREEALDKLRARNEELRNMLDNQRDTIAGFAEERQTAQQLQAQLTSAEAHIAELNQKHSHQNVKLEQKENSRETDELDRARKRSALAQQLPQTDKINKELRDTQAKLAQTTTLLNNARAQNKKLTASLQSSSAPAAVTPISVAQINKLKKTIAEKEELIASLSKKQMRSSKKQKPVSRKKNTTWQQGQTKIGTPGSKHKDDLKIINGIGPKIEKVLNRLGIKSWVQLATLKAADIKRIDGKLGDFSGRITRDEWVPQAKAIVRNANRPVTSISSKAKKKSKKSKPVKSAWQKGKTRFGTPGSIHKDDLQVINGIGPVIEKSLNRYGVKSWEQLASLKAKEVKTIDEALDFPGRITREDWVGQAKALIKQFPDQKSRPTRRTYLKQVAVAR